MKRAFALLLTLSMTLPVAAQNMGPPGLGWNVGGTVAPNDMPYITTSLQGNLTQERALAVDASLPWLKLVDNGPNSTIQLAYNSSAIPITQGGTGATTQQGAANAILGFSGVSTGDLTYFNGTNWVRLPIGSAGQVLSVSGGIPAWAGSTAGAPVNSAFVTIGSDATLTAERSLAVGSGLTLTDGGANSTATIGYDSAVLANLSSAQTLAGPKTLSGGPLIAGGTTDGLVFKGTTYNTTIKIADPAAARTYTIPETAANSSFVMTDLAQTINGVKTFSSIPVVPSGGITINTANAVTVTATNPAASRTYTLPDAGASANFVLSEGAATVNGVKTFGSSPVFPSSGIQIKTSGANSYTISGTNPSASRTYNLYDSGGNDDIALKSGTATSGAVAYGDGNKILFSAAGSDGQWLKRVSGVPAWTTLPQAFGGDSSDGSITISGSTTYSGPIEKNASSFTVNSSQTLTCNTGSPVVINSAGAVTINGTITCTAGSGGAGGAANAAAGATYGSAINGEGPNGGAGGTGTGGQGVGGGGGGCGGRGGRGGSTTATASYQGVAGAPSYTWRGGGGGGGAGNSNATSVNGGAGGNGGMALIICAVGAINLASTGTITNSGSAGGNGSGNASSGGGGGAGGTVWLISQTSSTTTASGTVTCNGANGGNGNTTGGGGGGGGGGKLILWSPSNTNSSTNTFTAGSGGTKAGTASDGESGANGGAVTITGTPNFPLLVFFGIKEPRYLCDSDKQKYGQGDRVLNVIEAVARMNGKQNIDICQRDIARCYAGDNLDEYAKAMSPDWDGNACLNPDADEVLGNVG